MTIKSCEEIVIYESPDGGRTVYARKPGETVRHVHVVDEKWQKDQAIQNRWVNLRDIVAMAATDPALNDLIEKVEIYYKLKQ